MPFLFNAGLPMIVPVMFFMAIGLIPIVLIEGALLAARLKVRFRDLIGSVVFGNIVSTIVGIPVTWFVLLMVQFVTGGASGYAVGGFWQKLVSFTLQAPWLLPSDESWLFSAAALFLLIPFFFASWLIEYVMMRDRLAAEVATRHGDSIELNTTERAVFRGVRDANLLSYGLFALLLSVSLLAALLE